MRCPKCNSDIQNSLLFCPECGHKFVEDGIVKNKVKESAKQNFELDDKKLESEAEEKPKQTVKDEPEQSADDKSKQVVEEEPKQTAEDKSEQVESDKAEPEPEFVDDKSVFEQEEAVIVVDDAEAVEEADIVLAEKRPLNAKLIAVVIAVIVAIAVIVFWLVPTMIGFFKPKAEFESYGYKNDVGNYMVYAEQNLSSHLINAKGEPISDSYDLVSYPLGDLYVGINYNNKSQEKIVSYAYINQVGQEIYSCKMNESAAIPGILIESTTINQQFARQAFKNYNYFERDGLYLIYDLEGKIGLIDAEGNQIVAPKYSFIGEFIDGLAVVSDKNKNWGFINKAGEEVVACQNFYVKEYKHRFAPVQNKDKLWGLVDREGKWVVQPEYHNIRYFEDALIAVQNADYKWGYIDKDGNQKIAFVYDDAWDFVEGKAVVKKDGAYALINKSGDMINNQYYQQIISFEDGYAVFKQNDLFGLFDKQGKIIVEPKYERISLFNEDLAVVVNKDGLYGYIDRSGQELIPCQYQSAQFFSEGLAAVQRKDTVGFIGRDGKIKIPFSADYEANYQRLNLNLIAKSEEEEQILYTLSFKKDRAIVRLKNGKYIYLNKDGKKLSQEYDLLYSFLNDTALVANYDNDKQAYLFGYINYDCKEIITPQYYLAFPFIDNKAMVLIKESEGIFKSQYINK